MRGSSAESLGRLQTSLRGQSGDAALGSDLLGASAVLRQQVAVRRAATDPSASADAKSALLRGVFASHVGIGALGVLAEAGSLRWASSNDLPNAVELLGVEALVRAADAAGEGDRLEDELFVVGRTLTENPQLRDALSDPARSAADKKALVGTLLSGKATAATIRLVEEAISAPQSLEATLTRYAQQASAVRNRRVATVYSAAPLNDEQQQRLVAALGKDNGSQVHLNVIVDATLVGGLRVEIGDHVIDGTIASRVDDARRKIAG